MTNPMTEHQTAPDTAVQPTYVAPRPKRLERQGAFNSPVTERYPEIRCGICTKCGVLDSHVPSEHQYKLCPHYRGMGEVRCSYCPDTKDPVDVMKSHMLQVAASPHDPSTLIAWCNSYDCSRRHLERFQKNAN